MYIKDFRILKTTTTSLWQSTQDVLLRLKNTTKTFVS
nr:MAG TPA: hypothetical protein [Caudoviricetes sp.]